MSDKNMADVADKAVDKLAAGVEQVAAAFKKVAPPAWDVMVRQQFVAGIVDLAAFAIGVVAVFVLARRAKTLAEQIVSRKIRGDVREVKRGYVDHDADPTMAFPWLAAAVLLTVLSAIKFVWWVPESVQQIVNPEYFAAKELLGAGK